MYRERWIPHHERTSKWSIPSSRLATSKHRSMGQRENAIHNSHASVTPSEPTNRFDTKYFTSSGYRTFRATISV